MNIDKTTNKDRTELHNEMSVDQTFRLDKVLFFTNLLFLVFKSQPSFQTLVRRTSQYTQKNLIMSTILPSYTSKLLE